MKRFTAPLSDGQHELFRHEPDKVGRIVGGKRRNPETDVTAAVRKYAQEHPGLLTLRRTHCGRSKRGRHWLYHGPEGWPDYTGGTWFGAAIVVECKREGEEPTADQENEMAKCREWGWIVISCASRTDFHVQFVAACARLGHPIAHAC